MRNEVRALALLSFALSASCMRYEDRPVPCPAQPPSRSTIAWEPTTHANTIVGRVVDLQARPVEGAYVSLTDRAGSMPTANDGLFRFNSVSSGKHTVLVRRVGYERATLDVPVANGGGAQLLVALESRPVVLDGCGIIVTRVRAAWWKFW
jgi:Carboxypeptidase regulatory-like domain